MGSSNSTTLNTQQILEEQTNNIVTNVLHKYSTSVSVAQLIDINCTQEQLANVTNACNREKENYYKMQIRMAELGRSMPEYREDPETSVCTFCSAIGVNQDAIVNITTDTNTSEQIASDIKSEMLNKLQSAIDTKSSGPFLSLSDTDITNITNIKNSVTNNFNNSIVNETLLNYTYSQTVKGSGVKIIKTNQKLLASGMSKNIISNLLNNDQSFKASVDSLDTIKSEQTNVVDSLGNTLSNIVGSVTSMFGSIWIVMLIIGVFIFMMFKDIILCLPPLAFTPLCKSNSSSQSPQQPYQQQP